jgi:hypothetical protein
MINVPAGNSPSEDPANEYSVLMGSDAEARVAKAMQGAARRAALRKPRTRWESIGTSFLESPGKLRAEL